MNVSVGIPTFNDFDSLFFTVQHVRLFQLQEGDEIVVLDNFGCDITKRFCEQTRSVRYIRSTDIQGTAAAKNLVIAEASGEVVICIDSHVLLLPGAVAAIRSYFERNPDSRDLVQGPLIYDDLTTLSTHFTTEWGNQMFGVWGTDERGKDPEGAPFDIGNMGMGAFSCIRKNWVGFNPNFRGFGGEEGYIHEKVRQHGGRTLCLPAFRWIHKFLRPKGLAYTLTVEEKLRNHLIGWEENCGDVSGVIEHFAKHASHSNCLAALKQAIATTGRADLYDLREIARLAGVEVPDDYPSSAIPREIPAHQPLVTCFMVVGADDNIDEYVIRRSVQSFLQQDYPNSELIIINNGSRYQFKTYAARTRILSPRSVLGTVEALGRFILENSSGASFVSWPTNMSSGPNRISTLMTTLNDMDMLEELEQDSQDSGGFTGIIARAAFEELVKPLTPTLLQDEHSFTVGRIDEPLLRAVLQSEETLFPVRPPVWLTANIE